MEEARHHGRGKGPAHPVVRELTVTDPTGFHCLPAGQIARIAMDFDGTIEVEREGRRADAKSVMELLGLLAVPDKNVKFRVIADGKGAIAAIENIKRALAGEIVVAEPPAKKAVEPPETERGWAYRWNSLWSKDKHKC